MASGNDLWNNQKTSSKVSKKTMNEFRNLCEGFLNNPDRVTKQVNAMVQEMSEKNKCAMKELAEIEKDIESMQQPCAFADIVFRTLYDRRLYNRAVVQQTPLILDHFKVNAKDSNVQLKLNDTSIAPFLWGQLEEWRRLEKDKPWQQRRRQSSEAIRAAEINRKRSLAMVESLQHDVALLQKIASLGLDECEQLRLKLMQTITSHTPLPSPEPSTSGSSTTSSSRSLSPFNVASHSTSSDDQEDADEFWSSRI